MSDDRLKLLYGYVLTGVIVTLGLALGLGKVEEKSSFGLRELILILGMLASQWAQWAFAGSRGKQPIEMPAPAAIVEPKKEEAKAA